MGPGIRCGNQSITPAPGVWDYDGRDMGGKTMSISVFQWVQSADGTDVKRGKEVRHFIGLSENETLLCQEAERLCQELELDPDVTHCSDHHVRIEVASDTTTSAEVLADLSKDENAKVRINVAKHRHTDSYILAKMSSDPDPAVRASVAWNPNTPESSVRLLVTDRIGTVVTAAKQAIAFRKKSA